ncbi:MAG: hypothetical protein KJN71_04185 [Acidimicrobiia bacterium]|nr:hypothetical protein [Acidimicrobiia bacterium]NNC74904.1 hypothetical protein [Acidimicrobiia bacterium]
MRTAGDYLIRGGVSLPAVEDRLPHVDPGTVEVRPAGRAFRMTWAKGIVAVAMPWGIYVHPGTLDKAPEDLARLIVHELVHIEQWRREGGAGHLRQYVGDYLRGRRARKGHWGSYRDIGLEIEARQVAAEIVDR